MTFLLIHIIYITITGTIALLCYYFKNNLFIWTKPLPVLGLVIIQIINLLFINTSYHYIFIIFISIALLAGMIGDILLAKKNMLIMGMISFVIGHIFYIMRFKQYKWSMPIYITIIVVAISVLFGIFLSIKMDPAKKREFLIPLWCYITIITLMLLSAINFEYNVKRGIPFYFIGALLFYISDAILSIDKFIKEFRLAMLFVLITYYPAQMFLSLGTIF
ncbi:MAG TPA: lysoplasmalogenase [Spirochaetota bacterium]|nr:lysoplasmalogenase [Spirochaetota bacterium]HOL57527.1 lysoplasmalogenase [Spirochaetota bacterium]HPP05252.1 lysoplasmalogenase [Spirochaetota bacterium]